MHLTVVSSKIPYGPSYPENTKRFNHLKRAKLEVKTRLEHKIALALSKCNANKALTDSSNNSCLALWDEIEECASKMSDIEDSLCQYWECWDNVECKMYDI